MIATGYTVRPTPDSGWVSFFELGRGGLPQGFFLILGPATTAGARPDPEWRLEAQSQARQIVSAWKSRLDVEPAEWLRLVAQRTEGAVRPLEFGALILRGDEVHSLCTGRVRVFPLTATARLRRGVESAAPGRAERTRVEPGDRYFFGRVPEELLRAGPGADLEGIERAGGRDGALILTFLAGENRTAPAGPGDTADLVPSRRLKPKLDVLPAGPPPVAPVPAPPVAPPPAAPIAEVAPPPPPVSPPTPPPAVILPFEPPAPPRPPAFADAVSDDDGEGMETTRSDEEAPRRRTAAPWLLAAVGVTLLAGWLLVGRSWLASRDEGAAESMPVEAAPTADAALEAPAPLDSGAAPPSAPGGIAWATQFSGAVTGTPLVLADRILVATRAGEIAAVDRRGGQILWTQSATKGFGGGLVGGDSLAVVAGFDGALRGFDPGDGRELFRLDTAGRIASPPVRTAEGFFVVASYDRSLYAYDPEERETVWKTRLGAILWASPGLGDKYLYQPGLDGVVVAINSRWGSVLWRYRAGGEIYSTPAVVNGTLVFGCEDGSIYGVTPEEGRLAWRTPAGAAVSGGVCAAGALALVGDDGGTLHALDASSGRVAWRYEAGTPIKSTPTIDSGVVVLSTLGGTLHAVELEAGAPIGRYPIGAPMASSPVISGDSLFVGTHDGRLVALRLR
jgi:outer membrane protein assembly factor BamB